MREPGPKTGAPSAGPSPSEPAQGGALWALIVGGAILVIAALLIFWPGGDAASGGAGAGKGRGGSAGQQASLAQSGGGPEGHALGVGARESDPHRGGQSRVNPSLVPAGSAGTTLAPPRKPKPEPTSFPSAAAEIEYWEKKLAAARQELSQRTLFLERMKKVKENARTSEQIETAERRGVIVQKNYDDQKKVVEDLEQKVEQLKKKQQQSGL